MQVEDCWVTVVFQRPIRGQAVTVDVISDMIGNSSTDKSELAIKRKMG
jgi:hypothetical protein